MRLAPFWTVERVHREKRAFFLYEWVPNLEGMSRLWHVSSLSQIDLCGCEFRQSLFWDSWNFCNFFFVLQGWLGILLILNFMLFLIMVQIYINSKNFGWGPKYPKIWLHNLWMTQIKVRIFRIFQSSIRESLLFKWVFFK